MYQTFAKHLRFEQPLLNTCMVTGHTIGQWCRGRLHHWEWLDAGRHRM